MHSLYRALVILSLFTALAIIGKIVFKIDFLRLITFPSRKEKKSNKRVKNYDEILKEQRRREILQTKPSLKERIVKRVKNTIELSELNITLDKFLLFTAISAVPGVVIGMVLRNPMLMVIVGSVTALYPFVYIHNKAKRKFEIIEENLPATLGNIIAQFLNERDFVVAVEKKLDQIPAPLDRYFTNFVNEVQILNIDTVTALRNLEEKIDNYYFKEFIQLAIQTEEQGEELKYTMMTIPEDMRDIQQEQSNFDLVRRKYNREFIATLVFFPLNILILRVGYKRYYDLLVYDIRGKIALAVISILMIYMTYKNYQDNKPIKIEID